MNKISLLVLFFIIISFSMNTIKKTDKYSLLKTFPNKYVPTVELYDENTDLEYINYPVIFKTNTCSFFGYDVKKIKNINEAKDYIKKFKYDKGDIIFQEFSPFENEIGVFLKRKVLDNKLEVYSGVIREIKSDSLVNNKCDKGKCKIVTGELSDIFKNKIIEITERVKGFNWGRYDIKYESFEKLNLGEFHIMELNGDTQGLIPIIYPMNFDLAVYWSDDNIILSIYKFVEIIFYYYALCIKNLITGKTGISDILMNINKWINNLTCY